MAEKVIAEFEPFMSEEGIWTHPKKVSVVLVEEAIFNNCTVKNFIELRLDDNTAAFTRLDSKKLLHALQDALAECRNTRTTFNK